MNPLSPKSLRIIGWALLAAMVVFFLIPLLSGFGGAFEFFGPLVGMLAAFVLLIIAELWEDRQNFSQGIGRGTRPFRTVDLLYFIVALPLALAAVHELAICPFVPSFGISGADDPNSCTIGWGIFFLIWPFILWVVGTLFVAPIRMWQLVKMGGSGKGTLIAYGLAVLLPLILVLSVIMS